MRCRFSRCNANFQVFGGQSFPISECKSWSSWTFGEPRSTIRRRSMLALPVHIHIYGDASYSRSSRYGSFSFYAKVMQHAVGGISLLVKRVPRLIFEQNGDTYRADLSAHRAFAQLRVLLRGYSNLPFAWTWLSFWNCIPIVHTVRPRVYTFLRSILSLASS